MARINIDFSEPFGDSSDTTRIPSQEELQKTLENLRNEANARLEAETASGVEAVLNLVPAGTVIPKPSGSERFVVKGWGRRRGQRALIYNIPNNAEPSAPRQKGITLPEFRSAYMRLMRARAFTKKWFDANMSECAAEGSCNFTTIGGIFVLAGIARYQRPGVYQRSGLHTPE